MTNCAYVVDGVCVYMKPDCAYTPLVLGIYMYSFVDCWC